MALVKVDSAGAILLIERGPWAIRLKVGEWADLALSPAEATQLASELLSAVGS